jgi:hypothetical protein
MKIVKLSVIFLAGLGLGYVFFGQHNDVVESAPLSKSNNKQLAHNAEVCAASPNSNHAKNAVLLEEPKQQPLPEKRQAILFFPETELIQAQSYQELVSQVSAEVAGLYANINQDFHNAFAFSNQQELQLALANGFPTPEELEYIYSKDVDELINDIYTRRNKFELTSHPDFPKVEKIGVLTFNRAMDEFITVLKQYRPEYQVGDKLSEFQQAHSGKLPSDLEEAIERVTRLRGLASGNLASSYIVDARFNELNPYNYDKDLVNITRLTQLAAAEVKLKTRKIRESLWSGLNDIPPEFIAIKTALLNIDNPNRHCPAT